MKEYETEYTFEVSLRVKVTVPGKDTDDNYWDYAVEKAVQQARREIDDTCLEYYDSTEREVFA